MKQGGDRRASNGFTIVEVMIVLAVTGLLFISAVLLINGRQNKTEFTTAINNFKQQVQQVINETSSGFYGSGVSCIAPGGVLSVSSGSSTNGQCTYLGKVMQYGTDTDSSQLATYPLIGLSQNAGGIILNLAAAKPVAVVPNSTYGVSVDATANTEMENGLTVAWVHYNGATSTGAIAFVAGDKSGNYASAGDTGLNSGSQQLTLYAVRATAPNASVASVATQIDAATSNLVVINDAAQICVNSGTTNEHGIINVAGDGSLAVTLGMASGSCP